MSMVRTRLRYASRKSWLEQVIASEHFKSCGKWAAITIRGRATRTIGSGCGGSSTSFPPAISVAQVWPSRSSQELFESASLLLRQRTTEAFDSGGPALARCQLTEEPVDVHFLGSRAVVE